MEIFLVNQISTPHYVELIVFEEKVYSVCFRSTAAYSPTTRRLKSKSVEPTFEKRLFDNMQIDREFLNLYPFQLCVETAI